LPARRKPKNNGLADARIPLRTSAAFDFIIAGAQISFADALP
jgi:hypothetical protein